MYLDLKDCLLWIQGYFEANPVVTIPMSREGITMMIGCFGLWLGSPQLVRRLSDSTWEVDLWEVDLWEVDLDSVQDGM